MPYKSTTFSGKGSTTPYKRTTYGMVKKFQTSTVLQRRKTQNCHVLTAKILDSNGTLKDARLKNLCASWIFNTSVNCLSSHVIKLLKLRPDKLKLHKDPFSKQGSKKLVAIHTARLTNILFIHHQTLLNKQFQFNKNFIS